jgi:hypothetical protein
MRKTFKYIPSWPGSSPSKTGVNALMPGHPRLTLRTLGKKDADARHKAGHDGV